MRDSILKRQTLHRHCEKHPQNLTHGCTHSFSHTHARTHTNKHQCMELRFTWGSGGISFKQQHEYIKTPQQQNSSNSTLYIHLANRRQRIKFKAMYIQEQHSMPVNWRQVSAKNVGGDVGMSMSQLHRTRELIGEERDPRNVFNYRTWAYVNDIRKQLETQSLLIPAELHKSNRDTIHLNSFKKKNRSD